MYKSILFICITVLCTSKTWAQQTLWFTYKQTTKDSRVISTLKSENRVVYDSRVAFIHNEIDDVYVGAFMYEKTIQTQKGKMFVYSNESEHELVIPESGDHVILNQVKLWNNSFKYSTRYFNNYIKP